MIDLHAHVLPGFDDGVRSVEEARELARAAADEGVTAIAATPHVRDDYPTTAAQMERGVELLRADFAREGIAVEILHGGELSLQRVWELGDESLDRFSLGRSGRYVLLEFPYVGWSKLLEPTVSALVRKGLRPLLAHPERNASVQERPERLQPLVAAGALLQLTAASVHGGLGHSPRGAAWRLLELGVVHVLATDSHGPHIRQGGLAAAAASLADEGLARYLTVDAPAAIVAGDEVPAPPDGR